jgi:hypothetical protein
MYQAEARGILCGMGLMTKAETASTSAADRPALERDRRKVEQGDETIALLRELVGEQRRTNQLLEWLGQERRVGQ